MSDTDQRVLSLFLAGASYHQIASAVELTTDAVHEAVCRQLADSDQRRRVLTEHRYAVNLERTEALLRAHWTNALRGDTRAGELCRRILERQLRHEAPMTMEGDAVDEITARRAARRAGTAPRKARA